MAATDPTYAKPHDASAWDAADGSAIEDWLTSLTDDDTTSDSGNKQGKGPDDILRLEFPNLSTIAVGDTVSVWIIALHNYGTGALLPYSSATGVTTTDKITVTMVDDAENVFTLTQAFIDDLFDQGSGTWAARFVEDGEINGDINITEIDSNLTVTGAAAAPTSHLLGPLYGPLGGPIAV